MTRKSNTARTVLSLSALALLVTGAVLYAGPLDPPAGPVTSTYKTLSEVEPRIALNAANTPGDADSLFKITQPGSYYLTGNNAGVVGKHGIEIVASGVTLDLNGFDLAGIPAMGAFDGVSVTVAGLRNIAVVNGSVRNWGRDGINLGEVTVTGCRVEGVTANGNTRLGIYSGVNSTVSGCSASGGQYGIYVRDGSSLTRCSATGASLIGLTADAGCNVNVCSAYSNTGTGIQVGIGSTFSNCSASSNSGNGISTSTGCTVSNCSAYQNTGSGFSVGAGSSVTNCSADSNTASGISGISGCTVADCTARLNTLDGIVCSFGCVIRGNTCSFNGSGGDGAGIHATSTDNRIEGNTCTLADRGIDVDSAGNIIIKNTCSGNTTNNWDVVSGNVILVVNATTAAAVTGNSGGTAPGSTDPNANFSY